ncbi:NADH-quinone oxidoreductase subunit J [Neorickettsia risticii]|uniref:NADH-quinone oxidoreductase subunit J n=1 Tax=Neorickettsia risticii (strain Illinois) TaxID=434131 RepID=C6V3P2_NEORI|nr:NADH-quinone oxidoreductase subunit J [Neorickettsia risticii]ACT69009.1 NADH dehydrogenase i, j subunit [Neorickettsia risticii str. Illinois]
MGILCFLLVLVAIFSSFRVVSCRNVVHAVLYLVLAFFTSSVLLLAAGLEVLSLMLLVVYVGAIAILFLFVVMMLNSDDFKKGVEMSVAKYVGLLFIALLPFFLVLSSYDDTQQERTYVSIKDIGAVLYTDYVYLFHLSGVVLLLAMVAAISIALPSKSDTKCQVVREQISRSSVVRLLNVPSGKGVDYD